MNRAKGRPRPNGKLRDVGEDRLIAQWLRQLSPGKDVVAGPGDDCAVVRIRGRRNWLLLKTDCVVERIHFASNARPAEIGWKAMVRTLSDFAGMSGLPRFALVTLILPATKPVRWTNQLYGGLNAAAEEFGTAIVGGETSATRGPAVISVAAVGEVEPKRCVRRSGGRAGDRLFVTGRLGGSIRGKHLRFRPRIAEARWLTEHFSIHAMMDLSDGLGADLPRLASASGVGFELQESTIPRARGCSIEEAINDGEDYELLFAVSSADAMGLERKWSRKFPDLPLTMIGRLTRNSSPNDESLGLAQKIENGKSLGGYQHFQKRG
ncbi:MAG: thiamine-phosphate kinase [Chthoniobacterales bacterium]